MSRTRTEMWGPKFLGPVSPNSLNTRKSGATYIYPPPTHTPEWVDSEEVVKAERLRVCCGHESLVERTGSNASKTGCQPRLTDEKVLPGFRPVVHDDSTHIPATAHNLSSSAQRKSLQYGYAQPEIASQATLLFDKPASMFKLYTTFYYWATRQNKLNNTSIRAAHCRPSVFSRCLNLKCV